MDVQVILLDKKLEAEKDPVKNSALKLEKHKLMKVRTCFTIVTSYLFLHISYDDGSYEISLIFNIVNLMSSEFTTYFSCSQLNPISHIAP